jgi:hypothetical protein
VREETDTSVSELKTQITQLTPEVEAAFEQKTIENVAIAYFDDGADNVPIKKLVVDITPVQSGSGVPSPDNVRPITGWTGAKVCATGVNLFDKTTAVYGYIDESNGVLKLPGSNYRSTDFVKVLGGQSYYIKTEQTNAVWGAWYDENKTYISGQTNYDNKVITAPNNAKYIRLTITSNVSGNVDSFSINYPASDHDYHPYGHTYSVTFPTEAGTVYGGTLDVINGVLTVDMMEVDLGTLSWSYSATYDWFTTSDLSSTVKKPPTGSVPANAICSKYPIIRQAINNSAKGISVWTNGTLSYWNNSEFSADAAIFKTAMTGVQLVYELATPITYTVDPTEVKTLLAVNNILADTGNVNELTYYAMNNTEAKITLTKAIIAPVLDSMTADTALVENDFRIVENTLYRVTTNIASGATLTPNTNCVAVTIAEILKSLLS